MKELVNVNEKDIFFHLFIKISVTTFVTAILFPFIFNLFFSDWNSNEVFIDSIGTLNTIFWWLALASVIISKVVQIDKLKNQNSGVSFQKNKINATSKKILIINTTTLVYDQLKLFEKAISEFKIKTLDEKIYYGNEAMFFLDVNENKINPSTYNSKEVYRTEMKKSLIKLFKIYNINKSEIEKLTHKAFTSIEVLKKIIYNTDIEINELNNLKNLFFSNVGFINMGVISRISEVANLQLEYLEPEDYLLNDLEANSLYNISLLLKSILEFNEVELTLENFNNFS